jgi:hypothetical protein
MGNKINNSKIILGIDPGFGIISRRALHSVDTADWLLTELGAK